MTGSAPGVLIGDKYRLIETIGTGGMGVVYRAEQLTLGRTVAIKMLRPEHVGSAERVHRFHLEARAASRLCHRGSVALYDFGITPEGTPYLVMEYVAGQSLSEFIPYRWPVPLGLVVDLGLQIVSAIADAHAAGVIHADIKSDNVLVETRRDGAPRTKIVDYGLARLADEAGAGTYGTPGYVAPEVACGQAVTVASDIYSIGATLYEMLTGSPPFDGDTAEEILDRQVADTIVPPSQRQPSRGISSELETVVMRALAKDPRRRYHSAMSLSAALEAARPRETTTLRRCSCGAVLPRYSVTCAECGTLRRTLGSGGLTRALTQDWAPTPERTRLARGSKHQPLDERLSSLRRAIGSAIVDGHMEDLAATYQELASTVAAHIGLSAAASELVEAVDVLTKGQGPRARGAPRQLWPVLVDLARYYELAGDRKRARDTAEHARFQAKAAGSLDGQKEALQLVQRLDSDGR